MTLVVAKRFENDVVIAADTLVTGPVAGAVQERLQCKVVPLSAFVTAAFATSNQFEGCLDRLKEARAQLRGGKSLPEVVAFLTEYTKASTTDFIICAHTPGLYLALLRDGKIFTGHNEYVLGDDSPLKDLQSRPIELPPSHGQAFEPWLLARWGFSASLVRLFSGEFNLAPTVGGFLVVRECRSHEHSYTAHAGTIIRDTINYPPGPTPDQLQAMSSGKTRFAYSCIAPDDSTAAVIGYYLEQISLLIVLAPFVCDNAILIRGVSQEEAVLRVKSITHAQIVSDE